MKLPFTLDEFLRVFGAYNQAIWPAHVVAYALGCLSVVLALRATPKAGRAASAILALAWLWVGVVYHAMYFAPINPAAYVFACFFVLQGVFLVTSGGALGRLRFAFRSSPRHVIGALFIAYAAILYPLLGAWLGHRYPASPTFGLTPCPVTIFTFGMFLWTTHMNRLLLLIPTLWALAGLSAALQLGMWEDLGLPVSAAVAVGFLALPRPGPRRRLVPRSG